MVELTGWEDAVQEAFERKKLRYSELAAEAEQQGWNVKICPVEVGCQGFVATSTIRLMKDLGISGQALSQAIKETSRAVEWRSQWLWLKRKDLCWSPK